MGRPWTSAATFGPSAPCSTKCLGSLPQRIELDLRVVDQHERRRDLRVVEERLHFRRNKLGALPLLGDAVPPVLINLGASQNDRGRYAEAEALYRQALAILKAFYGDDPFRTASGMTMLGRALVYQKRFDEGVVLLERALTVQERVNGPMHPRVASALNDLGSAALRQKRLDDAESRFRRMIEVYQKVYGDSHYLPGIALSNLASVLTEKKQYADAERLYREAIAIYERTLSPTHLNTGIGRIKLGRVLLRQTRYGEAEKQVLAGYAILKAQASPAVSWLKSAREDLIAIYDALGQPRKAEPFRAEPGSGSK